MLEPTVCMLLSDREHGPHLTRSRAQGHNIKHTKRPVREARVLIAGEWVLADLKQQEWTENDECNEE